MHGCSSKHPSTLTAWQAVVLAFAPNPTGAPACLLPIECAAIEREECARLRHHDQKLNKGAKHVTLLLDHLVLASLDQAW